MKTFSIAFALLFLFTTEPVQAQEETTDGCTARCCYVRRGTMCDWVVLNLCCWQVLADGDCYICVGYPLCTCCYAYTDKVVSDTTAFEELGAMEDVGLQWFDDQLWVVAEGEQIVRVQNDSAIWNTELTVRRVQPKGNIVIGNKVYDEDGNYLITLNPETTTAEDRENLYVIPIEEPRNIRARDIYKYPIFKKLTLSPNPAADFINLNMEFSKKASLESVSIINQNGKVVLNLLSKTRDFEKGELFGMEFDISSLVPGNYQLVVQTKHERISRPLVKG